MICNKCKSQNPNNSTHCIYCGAELQSETKICPNGHIYEAYLDECPICPSPEIEKKLGFSLHSKLTVPNIDNLLDSNDKTVVEQFKSNEKSKTVIIGKGEGGEEKYINIQSRKIVGWLITFSIRPNGDDYKLFEGRNLITGSGGGDIIIPDPAVSTPHCMILYRNGKFIIKDELSTNGTYVNGVEIYETELKDGDLIKIGKTELKLRTVN